MDLPDFEKLPPLPEGVGGYIKLAQHMGHNSNRAIFRRFGDLNALNLLYLQAELVELENELLQEIEFDRKSTSRTEQARCVYWPQLANAIDSAGTSCPPWKLMLRIREVLKEYNHALMQQNTTCKFPRPHKEDLHFLQDWMKAVPEGNVMLIGPDKDIWRSYGWSELVALDVEPMEEPITSWMSRRVTNFHNIIGKHLKKHQTEDGPALVAYYPKHGIQRITFIAVISLSSALPLLPILVLNALQDTHAKIGVIAVFTILFSAVLSVISHGKKTEILSAAAAYAAVQVVFITNNDGSGSNTQTHHKLNEPVA